MLVLVALGVALLLWWLPGDDTSRLNETTITPAVAAPPPVAVVEPLPEIPEVPATEADPLPSTRAIQGRVISAHGDEPIVGAEISVFVPALIDPSNPRSDLWNRRLGQAISDEEGEFTFSGLEPRGDYSIEVEHRHWLDDSFDINLTAGDLTTDFPLLRGASICGVVVGLGEEDKLFRIRLTGEGYVSSKYKAPGEPFCFEAVPAGELELEITRELANSLEVAYIPVRVDTPFQQISLGTLDLTKGEKVTLRSRCEDEGFVGYSLINLRVLTFDDFNPVYSASSERPYGVSLLGGLNGPDQFEIRGRLSGLKVQIKATSHSPDYKFSWGEVRPQKGENLNLTFDCELDPSGLRIENGADLELSSQDSLVAKFTRADGSVGGHERITYRPHRVNFRRNLEGMRSTGAVNVELTCNGQYGMISLDRMEAGEALRLEPALEVTGELVIEGSLEDRDEVVFLMRKIPGKDLSDSYLGQIEWAGFRLNRADGTVPFRFDLPVRSESWLLVLSQGKERSVLHQFQSGSNQQDLGTIVVGE